MVKQPDSILHLDRLEETGAKAEKPDQAWCLSGSCLSMEPEQEKRLGGSSKPDFDHDHHVGTTHPTRL